MKTTESGMFAYAPLSGEGAVYLPKRATRPGFLRPGSRSYGLLAAVGMGALSLLDPSAGDAAQRRSVNRVIAAATGVYGAAELRASMDDAALAAGLTPRLSTRLRNGLVGLAGGAAGQAHQAVAQAGAQARGEAGGEGRVVHRCTQLGGPVDAGGRGDDSVHGPALRRIAGGGVQQAQGAHADGCQQAVAAAARAQETGAGGPLRQVDGALPGQRGVGEHSGFGGLHAPILPGDGPSCRPGRPRTFAASA